MHVITSTSELTAFCASVESGDYITVDTEFLRDKTYFPKLCLLQIAGPDQAAAIDPLADGIDLAPAFALMQKKSLTKVFHACRQDIEIFNLLSGRIPSPIFDTQVAAAVCGYGESVSYESLVNQIVGAELDKSSRFTDWGQRPLTEKQLAYALSDVTHLRVIYETLLKKVTDAGRASWIEEEHAYLTDPALYDADPGDAWKRLKFGNMRPKHLAVLRELARWRETEARATDVPRGRIIKDDILVELAQVAPRKEADLVRLRSLAGGLSKNRMASVLACVETALALPPADYPQVAKHRKHPENITGALAMLQLLLKVQSDKHGIASSIVAGKEDLETIALGGEESPVLHGWRHDVFGRKARLLMQGKLKLSLDPKKKTVLFDEAE